MTKRQRKRRESYLLLLIFSTYLPLLRELWKERRRKKQRPFFLQHNAVSSCLSDYVTALVCFCSF